MAKKLVPRHLARSYAPYGACHDCVLCIRQAISGVKETKRKCTRCGVSIDTKAMFDEHRKVGILNQVLMAESWRKENRKWAAMFDYKEYDMYTGGKTLDHR
jgi:hypothetical protein